MMYLLYAFLVGAVSATELSAGVGPAVDPSADHSANQLYQRLVDAPPRAVNRPMAEVQWFCRTLREYLAARRAVGARHDLAGLLDAMVVYAEFSAELTELFATLADRDGGLSPREIADLMMSGRFFDYDKKPLSPARAIQKSLRALPNETIVMDQWHFDLFEELARHVRDFEQWDNMADFTRGWFGHAHDVSRALVSNPLDVLQTFDLDVMEWFVVLSFYRPKFIDSVECAKIVGHFKYLYEIVRIMPHVPDADVRLCLQDAAVRRLKRPSQSEVRTLLRPVGWDVHERYVKSLKKLEDEHMKRAWRTDCGSLLAVTSNDRPNLPPPEPPRLRLIQGGLRSSP